MGLTFKSNIASVKKLSLASGFLGPQDFKTYADFNTQEYLKNGNDVTLSNVISSQRPAVSYALSSDVLDSFSIVPINTPIRSYIYDYKTFGIYPDWSDRINRMLDVSSEQAWIGSAAEDNVIYSIYSLDMGNATVNPLEFDVLSGDGSPEYPMFFKQKLGSAPKSANIIRLNGCISCVVQATYKGESLLVPHKDQTPTANETLAINVDGGTDGTVFLKLASSKRKSSAGSSLIPLLKLEQDSSKYLAVVVQPDNYLAMRYFFDGTEQAFFKSNRLMFDRGDINKLSLSWSNGVISLSVNGIVEFVASLSMGVTFQPATCTVISPIQGWVEDFSNLSLLEMASYDRRLVTTELSKLTG
ncbi:hypothetical protein [Acinetobacter pseudolwoffii]|uniref:Uncharacterized protein n=1 Tax=Acinetobacter pseudolwoffii TaxID=2053287 RepID=A0A2H9YS93_9GAMM|nr:hypothetical protein [Acinetobacter pseudolwoffii]PJO75506.1 hypothetical protein CWI32_08230 [Acinetobacter pseudolwoffii]